MSQHLSDERTAIAATYSNRQDAEIAKAQLVERGMDALIVADDTHPPFQLTEGVKLCVLEERVDQARRVLEEAHASAGDEMPAGMSPESAAPEEDADVQPGSNGFVQATAWLYVAAFLFMVSIILTGLLIGQ